MELFKIALEQSGPDITGHVETDEDGTFTVSTQYKGNDISRTELTSLELDIIRRYIAQLDA